KARSDQPEQKRSSDKPVHKRVQPKTSDSQAKPQAWRQRSAQGRQRASLLGGGTRE
ncbi:MAG: hypothetical protein GY753_20240, partial [Gammaproteobacteria bacterium]|nr:hypothetical protein [Gammaproteobacteria bacterium]